LTPSRDTAMLRVEGDNRPGLGYDLMSRIAVAGINLRGLSVSTFEHHFTTYLAFENADDLTTAIQLLATLPD
jgi:predicted amino acid-binding ACT domain protein